MKSAILAAIAALLLPLAATAQPLSAQAPMVAYSEIDLGAPFPLFGVAHLAEGNVWLGPVFARHVPDPDTPPNSIGGGGSTIQSEWMSGNIKRTITTHSPPGRQGRRLALSRHNSLVKEALNYWPIDP